MIFDRPIDLPVEIGGDFLNIKTETGEEFSYRAWFTNLSFHVVGSCVDVRGKVVLRKFEHVRRPWWHRPLGVVFKAYRGNMHHRLIWDVRSYSSSNVLIGSYPTDLIQAMTNAGLKDRLLLHSRLINRLLEIPRIELRRVHERVAPEILGQPLSLIRAA